MKRSLGVSIVIQTLALIAAIGLWAGLCGAVDSYPSPQVPVEGKITMVDFGESGCFGCWMQAPIIEKIEKKYRDSDQVAIVFINITTHVGQVAKYQIEELPTQIFYDKDGKEVYRHKGFMFESSIVSRLTKMGAKQ